jgi:EmrB/QacA subfamily drug resistance transporter
MTTDTEASAVKGNNRSQWLMILLAMAMFVLVIDTSMMNVSISAIVEDLGTTVSGVQSAISLEALVSAAFILIGSKLGDLYGRKRAYILGLMGYALGALTMTLTQSITLVILFWAIIGGLGASLLLPAMQSLIHGNFEGAELKKAYALVGAAAAIAAAVGPLIGGFITTYLSWRVGFFLEFVIIVIVLLNIKLVKDVKYEGPRDFDVVGAILSVIGMAGIVISILIWEDGGESVGLLMAFGFIAMFAFYRWLVHNKKQGKPVLIDPGLFSFKFFRLGITGLMLQNIILGGMMIVLPIYFQMVFEYTAMQTGLAIAPLSLSMFALALLAGRRSGKRRPGRVIQFGFLGVILGTLVMILYIPTATSGWDFVIPMVVTGAGLGLLVSQLNNYSLSPITEERISEAAGVNSASGNFGLSFGLAFAGAIMMATLALTFTNMAQSSLVLSPEQQTQVAAALEEDAQIMSDTQLEAQLAGQTEDVQAEILRINQEARNIALQVSLMIPFAAALIGFLNSFLMLKLPDPEPSSAAEGVIGG